MNQNKIALLLVLLLAFGFSACDIIGPQKTEPNPPINGQQKVLLEDFTGHKCGNCPNAHRMLETLLESYEDNLIPVAIHAGFFANTNATYPVDYTTPLGDEIFARYEDRIINYPVGFLNRRAFNGTPAVDYTGWSSRLFELLSQDAPLVMEVASQYDSGTRELKVEVNMQYFQPGDADHRLVVLITEDSLVSPQLDDELLNEPNAPVPPIEQHYVHNHVLRTTVTDGGLYGVTVKGNEIFVGEKLSREFSYTLPQEYRAEKCHAVAYVIRGSDLTVLQAEQVKVAE